MAKPDVELEPGADSVTVRTPDGTIIMVMYYATLGTSVAIYDDPETNPVVTYMGKKPNANKDR